MAAKHSAEYNSLQLEHNPVWAKYEAIKAQIEVRSTPANSLDYCAGSNQVGEAPS